MLHSEYLSRIVLDRYKHFQISRYSPTWRLWHILMSQNNMQTVLNRPIVSSAGSIIILINEPSASVVTSYEIKTNNCSQSRKRGMIHSASCMWTSSDTQTSFQERLLISASSFCWTSLAESDSLTASDVGFFVTSMTSERLSPAFCLLMADVPAGARCSEAV